jgi:glycosyltransferase involved in cell wall biosynthesis
MAAVPAHHAASAAQATCPGRVVVLMSTYNGARYVAEQLRSILEQLPADGLVLVRDDGSQDDTVQVVQALRDPRVSVTQGLNLGFGASFLTLLGLVPKDAGLVLFSDQDDVWLPGKIARAGAALAGFGERPALYGSAQILVDETLRPIQATPPWPSGPTFQGALTENMITGCTAALNRAAVDVLQQAGTAAGVRFHDWWCYVVISALGEVVLDGEPTLLYRQHGRNQIGHGAGWWGRQRQIARFILRNDWVGILLAQVRALDVHYRSQLSPSALDLLNRYFTVSATGALPRWRLVFSTRRWRHRWLGEVALRLLLAAYRLHLWPLPGKRLMQTGRPALVVDHGNPS